FSSRVGREQNGPVATGKRLERLRSLLASHPAVQDDRSLHCPLQVKERVSVLSEDDCRFPDAPQQAQERCNFRLTFCRSRCGSGQRPEKLPFQNEISKRELRQP